MVLESMREPTHLSRREPVPSGGPHVLGVVALSLVGGGNEPAFPARRRMLALGTRQVRGKNTSCPTQEWGTVGNPGARVLRRRHATPAGVYERRVAAQ